MSKKTEAYIKSSAAGLIAGGLAFMAVNSLSRHSMKRRSTAKVFRMLGALVPDTKNSPSENRGRVSV